MESLAQHSWIQDFAPESAGNFREAGRLQESGKTGAPSQTFLPGTPPLVSPRASALGPTQHPQPGQVGSWRSLDMPNSIPAKVSARQPCIPSGPANTAPCS